MLTIVEKSSECNRMNYGKKKQQKEPKNDYTLLMFSLMDFYPSISEKLQMLSLDYARQFTKVSDEDLEIITQAKKSLLFNNN